MTRKSAVRRVADHDVSQLINAQQCHISLESDERRLFIVLQALSLLPFRATLAILLEELDKLEEVRPHYLLSQPLRMLYSDVTFNPVGRG